MKVSCAHLGELPATYCRVAAGVLVKDSRNGALKSPYLKNRSDRPAGQPAGPPGRASRPGPRAGPPRTGKEDLPKKRIFGVKNENRRFGAIFGRVWPQLGQNRNQREKLAIEMGCSPKTRLQCRFLAKKRFCGRATKRPPNEKQVYWPLVVLLQKSNYCR